MRTIHYVPLGPLCLRLLGMEVGETMEGGSMISCPLSIAHLISRADRYIRVARGRQDLVGMDLDRVAIRQRDGQFLTIVGYQHTLDPSFHRLALRWQLYPEEIASFCLEVVGRRNTDVLRAIILGDTKDAFARESAPRDPGANIPDWIVLHD